MTTTETCSDSRLLRPHLQERLQQSQHYALTLLLAPAGCGKSTLLQQWATSPTAPDTVLLSLTEEDNDQVRLFNRLADAIRRIAPAFDTTRFNPFDSRTGLPPAATADAFADAVRSTGQHLTLIIDEFQNLRNSRVLQALDCLLEDPPAALHLIFASRTLPRLRLGKLRLDGRLQTIDQQALQVTAAEAAELCRRLGDPNLPAAAVDQLLAVTEGWMAGLRLALLAASRTGLEAIACFNGRQPEVVDYFGDVVFRGLPEEQRELFVQSALFDQISGPLCDHTLQRTGSALTLERVAAHQLFVIPVENRPGWYRYHTLLRDFLASRLAVESPDIISGLHRRAADYFQRQGDLDRALRHTRDSGDSGLFATILAEAFNTWGKEGSFYRILQWADELAGSNLLLRPEIAPPLICTLTLSRQFHRAGCLLEVFRRHHSADGEPQGDLPLVIRFLELHLELFQHDTDFLVRDDLQHLLLQSQDHYLHAFTLCMVAYHHLQHARLDLALRHALQAREEFLHQGHRFMAAYVDLIIALCNRTMGRLDIVHRDVQKAFEDTPPRSPARILRSTAMIVAFYEQNRLDDAHDLCADLLPRLNATSATEVISTVYLTHARTLFQQGKPDRARHLIGKLQGILRPGNYDRFDSHLAAESLRQAFISGDRVLVESAARQFGIPEEVSAGTWDRQRPYTESWERLGLAAVYWLQANRRLDTAERILRVLIREVEPAGIISRAVVLEANLLVVTARKHDRLARSQALRRTVMAYGLMRFSRSVLDEAPGFGSLLMEADRCGVFPLPTEYIDVFRDALEPTAARSSAADPTTLLTDKEQEIYHHLLAGLSNNDISIRTGITIATTKWHLKNIYSKLGVSNRTEAVLRHRTVAR